MPSPHIHFYDFVNHRWISSTDNSSQLNSRPVTPLQVGRMNHACIKFSEGGRSKVMVAGGVTASDDLEFSVVRSVEVLDVQSLTWRRALDIPTSITGSRLILVDGRPCLVGRYGEENTRALLRYSEQNTWQSLPVQLLEGRSDYQIIRDLPATVRWDQTLTDTDTANALQPSSILPNIYSVDTDTNPGQCKTSDFNNKLFSIKQGKKQVDGQCQS